MTASSVSNASLQSQRRILQCWSDERINAETQRAAHDHNFHASQLCFHHHYSRGKEESVHNGYVSTGKDLIQYLTRFVTV